MDTGGATCKGIEHTGQCPEGKIPYLSQANLAFWRIFERIMPGLFRGWDGYDYEAIRIVFRICGVSKHLQAIYLDQCLAVINVIQRIREKKQDRHG